MTARALLADATHPGRESTLGLAAGAGAPETRETGTVTTPVRRDWFFRGPRGRACPLARGQWPVGSALTFGG